MTCGPWEPYNPRLIWEAPRSRRADRNVNRYERYCRMGDYRFTTVLLRHADGWNVYLSRHDDLIHTGKHYPKLRDAKRLGANAVYDWITAPRKGR